MGKKKKADLAKLAIDGKIMLMVMSCCCLGLLFHVNYVVIMFYGLPFLTEPGWSLNYYINAGQYPWSVSILFWWVTLLVSSFVVVTVWYRSRKMDCKWRLRFLVLLMSFICFGFAAFCSSLEDLTVEYTKYKLDYLKEEIENDPELSMQEVILRKMLHTENVLKRWEESKSGMSSGSRLERY